MKHWVIVGIAIAIMSLHERLSATKYWFLGSLLPLAGIGALIYQLLFTSISFSIQSIIAYVGFFCVTIIFWALGRHEYKQKELKRMKARDIE